jgi:hypothetical protein
MANIISFKDKKWISAFDTCIKTEYRREENDGGLPPGQILYCT